MIGSSSIKRYTCAIKASGPDRFNVTPAPEEGFSTFTAIQEVESTMCLPVE